MAFSYWQTGNFGCGFRAPANQGDQGSFRDSGRQGYGYQNYVFDSLGREGWNKWSFSGSYLRTGVPLASTLTDDFTDNSFDAAKWSQTPMCVGEAAVVNAGTVSETGGQATITPPSSTATISYTGYKSVASYDLAGTRVFVRLVTATNNAQEECYFSVGPDANHNYQFSEDGGTLQCRLYTASQNFTTIASLTYNSSTHAWLAIRHNAADNAIHWETAPSTASNPPLDSDWVDRGSATVDAGAPVGSVRQAFGAGTWGSVASPATVIFDGFNTATAATASYSLSCATAVFALTGIAANLAAAHVLTAASGSFVLTGNAMTSAVTMSAARGTFVLNGNPTTLGVAMPAATGIFTLSGTPTGPSHGYKLVVTAGTFTLTGNATGLIAARKLTMAAGVFSLSAQAVALPVAMSALTGTFALTFQGATLAVTIAMARGTFSLTGIAASLKAARLLSASTGIFVLTGNAAGLNKVGSSTLTATTGSFTLTGIAAGALRGARLSAGTGSFALSGITVALRSAHLLTASRGAFVLTGAAAGIIHQAQISLAAGAFNLTGFAVVPAKQSRLQADTGEFVVTGMAARILSVVLPTPESRRVAGVMIDRSASGGATDRTTAGNLQRRLAAG